MLLGIWRTGADWAGAPFGLRLPSQDTSGGFESQHGLLRAKLPARLLRKGPEATAWLHIGPGYAEQPEYANGPQICLNPQSLTFTSGALPQFPLYYYRSGDDSTVVVCSEMATLLSLVPACAVNVPRLVALSAWRLDHDPGATAFQGIRRVLACERWAVDSRGARSTRSVPSVRASYRRDRPEDLAVELRQRLDASVERAIGGARRVAVYVSGGLDSSGVAALALARCRGASNRQLQAIAGVCEAPGDDRPHLEALERELGIVAVRVRAPQAAQWFAKSLCTDRQPQLLAGSCGEMLLWAEGAARGAEVALGGYGGDNICGGDVSFAAQAIGGRPIAALTNALRLQVPWRASVLHRLMWVASPLMRPLLPDAVVDSRRRRNAHGPWMTPRYRELLDPQLHGSTPSPRTPAERMAHFCEYPLWGELAVSWGQITSVTGATCVDVFRDLDFVRFMAEIDPVVVSHDHRYRGLYRLAMRGLIPDSVRLRSDKALAEPFLAQAALSADALGLLERLGSLDQMAALGLVDPTRFAGVLGRWLRSLRRGERAERDEADGAMWNRVWPLLAVEAFLRQEGGAERGGGVGRGNAVNDGRTMRRMVG